MSSSSNVLNIGKIMRSSSDGFRVAPGAVKEMSSRINDWFETNIPGLCDMSKSHGRKTIMEDDVVEFFGLKKNGFLGE